MPCRESEEEDEKASRNDGACHAEPDAEGTEDESDPDVEKKIDESTGKKREYHPFLQYTEVKHSSRAA